MTATNSFDLDPEISSMCEDAQAWLMMTQVVACKLGTTLAGGIVAMLPRKPRIHTGYKPEPVRRNVRHRGFKDGLGRLVRR